MAFPSVASTTTFVDTTGVLAHVVSYPASIAAGDLLLVFFAQELLTS